MSLRARAYYYDAKTVHINGARYPDTNGIDAARGAAVETRARAVPGEYERHACARDVEPSSTTLPATMAAAWPSCLNVARRARHRE